MLTHQQQLLTYTKIRFSRICNAEQIKGLYSPLFFLIDLIYGTFLILYTTILGHSSLCLVSFDFVLDDA